MKEPSLRSSRLALAGGLIAVIVVGGGGFLLGRGTTDRAPMAITPAPAPAITPAVTTAPRTPITRKVLGRADFIAMAQAATEGAISGSRIPSEGADVDGQRFEIRLPFGCEGPSPEGSTAAMRWRYDAEAAALRVHVAPVAWQASDWWTDAPPANIDAIEGFWIERPWTASDTCPAASGPTAAGAQAITLPGQVLALGQLFSADAARDGQRGGNPYDTVVRMAQDDLDMSQGLRLRIRGRIASMPDGGPARCQQPGGSEQRPICLIGVVMDEAAIENPAKGDVIATWNLAQRGGGER